MTRASRLAAVSLLALLASVQPAYADVTAFLGVTTTPDTRMVRGFSGGLGLLFIGFEFEYANTSEDEAETAGEPLPGLKTYSGNVLIQTPIEVSGISLYGTAGIGGYSEVLREVSETNVAFNLGGGAKIRIAGPLRIRLDYRMFTLQGSPIYERYHRFYAGANIAF
jgi:hypothetical protein